MELWRDWVEISGQIKEIRSILSLALVLGTGLSLGSALTIGMLIVFSGGSDEQISFPIKFILLPLMFVGIAVVIGFFMWATYKQYKIRLGHNKKPAAKKEA